jgi:hypothetical protein
VSLTPVTIVGVNPPNFSGPVAADTSAPEIFLPLSILSTVFPDPTGVLMDPNTLLLQVMARSKPGPELATSCDRSTSCSDSPDSCSCLPAQTLPT